MNHIENDIKKSCKIISKLLKNGNPFTMSSYINNKNKSGDIVKNLDIEANNIMIDIFSKSKYIRQISSEENDTI